MNEHLEQQEYNIKPISDTLSERTQRPLTNESGFRGNNARSYAVSLFVERINDERKGTKYKPMTSKGVAMKLSHVKTGELHGFYKQCESYDGSFSKCFFGSLKV